MGSPHLRRKNYKMPNQSVLAAVINEPPGYQFEVAGQLIDLEPYKQFDDKQKDIAWGFAIVLWRRRNDVTSSTATNHVMAIDRFFEYLHGESGLFSLASINQAVFNYFTYWMKTFAVKRGRGNTPLSESSKRKIWGVIRSYIRDLMKFGMVDPNIRLPSCEFDQSAGEMFKPYSDNEVKQIIAASRADIHKMRHGQVITVDGGHTAYIAPLIPYAFLLSLRTGLNPEVLFEIDVTEHSLQPSYLLNSTRLILPIKRRSGNSQNIEIGEEKASGVRIKSHIVRLLQEVEELTQPVRDALPDDHPLKDKLWLVQSDDGKVDVFRNFTYYLSLASFAKRHKIVDTQGELVTLNFRRFRPTFAENMLKVNGGDIRDLQKRLGHINIRTTMGYLDPNLEERKEAFKYAGRAMEQWALHGEERIDVRTLASELDIPVEAAEQLANGDFDMGAGKCKNPFDSPLKGVKKGDLCTNYLACFRCGNCVVFKEDSHRLFSFYYWLLEKKAALGEEKWEATYGWIIDIIEQDVAPKLGDANWVAQEKENALKDPFPMWATDITTTSVVDTTGLA